MGRENVFHDIFERKTSFKDYKISKLKKSKNWFWSKINNFPFCYFTRNREEIFVLRYSRKKKRLRRQ